MSTLFGFSLEFSGYYGMIKEKVINLSFILENLDKREILGDDDFHITHSVSS
jgi:hypothetical protein